MSKSYGATFTGDMILAILENRKSMTRRVIEKIDKYKNIKSGDTLYFQEKFKVEPTPGCSFGDAMMERKLSVFYADGERQDFDDGGQLTSPELHIDIACSLSEYKIAHPDNYGKWHPGMFMPEMASRIQRTVVRTWTERVQDISEEDAFKEGALMELQHYGGDDDPWHTGGFINLWDSINARRGSGWEQNPLVRVIEWRNE